MGKHKTALSGEEKRVFEIATKDELSVLAYIDECRQEITDRMGEIAEKQKEIDGILWHLYLMKTARENRLRAKEEEDAKI